jgi:hypothetical protein
VLCSPPDTRDCERGKHQESDVAGGHLSITNKSSAGQHRISVMRSDQVRLGSSNLSAIADPRSMHHGFPDSGHRRTLTTPAHKYQSLPYCRDRRLRRRIREERGQVVALGCNQVAAMVIEAGASCREAVSRAAAGRDMEPSDPEWSLRAASIHGTPAPSTSVGGRIRIRVTGSSPSGWPVSAAAPVSKGS